MLSLANDGRYPAVDLISEQRRQRTLDALAAQLPGLARQQPVLMIAEDAHWIDPTSLEVFGRTVELIKTLPALLIVTFRPAQREAAFTTMIKRQKFITPQRMHGRSAVLDPANVQAGVPAELNL